MLCTQAPDYQPNSSPSTVERYTVDGRLLEVQVLIRGKISIGIKSPFHTSGQNKKDWKLLQSLIFN